MHLSDYILMRISSTSGKCPSRNSNVLSYLYVMKVVGAATLRTAMRYTGFKRSKNLGESVEGTTIMVGVVYEAVYAYSVFLGSCPTGLVRCGLYFSNESRSDADIIRRGRLLMFVELV
jgi:hypothetical protein